MSLLKGQKQELAQKYVELVEGAKNVVVLQHTGLPVNVINDMRQGLEEVGGSLKIVKKRVFLKGIEGKFHGLTLDQIPGSVALLVSHDEENEFAPLKVVSNAKKNWKKAKKTYEVDYVGAWIGGERSDAYHVSNLADLPSKDELVSKFLFLLKHPVASFVRAIDAVANLDVE